jgi:hypothetical protein
MEIVTVWLLVMVGHVNSGGLGAVQPHLFPTAAACERVSSNATTRVYWRCVETKVLVPKGGPNVVR